MPKLRLRHKIHFRDAVCLENCTTQQRSDSGAAIDGATDIITGHAVVTNSVAQGWGWTEEVATEAITKVMESDLSKVRALFHHKTEYPIARYPDTLELKQDDKGLAVRITPIDTSYSRDLIEAIRVGVVDKMSFGFYILDEKIVEEKGKVPHFIIKEIELLEVSPVTYPFYGDTDVGIENQTKAARDFLDQRLSAHGATHNTKDNRGILDLTLIHI